MSYGAYLIETLLILIAVCVLAWLVVRFGARRLGGAGATLSREGAIRIVDRLTLEPRRTVYVIEAGGKTLLVGVTDGGGMTTLAELSAEAVASAKPVAGEKRSFLELLRGKTG